MRNSIIVTIKMNTMASDMELPRHLPVKELSRQLLSALQTLAPMQFGRVKGIWLVHNGKYLLDEAASLADYGILDGDYLSVVEMEGSYR